MKRFLKWVALGFAGLAGMIFLAVLGVFVGSEAVLHHTYPKAEVKLAAATDPGAAARGAQIARVYGCHDCHGEALTGRLFHDDPKIARITGPNLTLAIARQSDADLARALRLGVASDGRALWIMPSQMLAHLSDAETADLLAYLRTQKPQGEPVKHPIALGPVGRLGAVLGKFAPSKDAIPGPALPDYGPQLAEGRGLARACTECHGQDLKGEAMVNSPDLTIAAAYDLADFERLMRTGVAAGGRKVGLMSETAVSRFSGWSPAQVSALHEYLKARALAQPPA
jgi:cytochrome c553